MLVKSRRNPARAKILTGFLDSAGFGKVLLHDNTSQLLFLNNNNNNNNHSTAFVPGQPR